MASLTLASTFVAKPIFNNEDNDHITNTEGNDDDDSAPTYCFMARGAMVNLCDSYFQTSSEDDSECEPNPAIRHFLKLQLNNRLLWKIFKNC